MKRTRRTAGVTLVEAMVAITILTIVSTLVWGAYDQTLRNKQRVEGNVDRNHQIFAALDRMQRELSMAFVSIHFNESPSLQTVRTCFIGKDHGERDRIDFTSFSHQRLIADAHESDQNELSYFITSHPDDRRIKVLARREQNRIDDDPQEGGHIAILVEDVEGLDLEYLDPVSNTWQRNWDTTQTTGQPNRLPSQVRITLTVPNPHRRGAELTYGTRVTIPVTHALNHSVYISR
ncbi:MAG: general secretion pathway protein GspJ [Sandaracinus sp.]|nr:general secretion pathway protein GspJ [Sandaracinus sp.]|tara:strand:+ start:2559 stop:3260 length:702 start_codon:yes stop_codon:yes gene_type:complete